MDVTDKSDEMASKVFTFAPSKGPGVLPSANTDTELAAVEIFLSDDTVDSIIEMINSYARTKVQMNMPFRRRSMFANWWGVSKSEFTNFWLF